jgi:hypothetical protein
MRKGAIIILAVLMASLLVSQVDALAAAGSITGGLGHAQGGWFAKVTVTSAEKSSAIDSEGGSHHHGWEKDAAKTAAFTSVKAVAVGPCGAGAEAAAGAAGIAVAV